MKAGHHSPQCTPTDRSAVPGNRAEHEAAVPITRFIDVEDSTGRRPGVLVGLEARLPAPGRERDAERFAILRAISSCPRRRPPSRGRSAPTTQRVRLRVHELRGDPQPIARRRMLPVSTTVALSCCPTWAAVTDLSR